MLRSISKTLFGKAPEVQDFSEILPTVLKTLDDLGMPFEGDQELGLPLLEHAVRCLT